MGFVLNNPQKLVGIKSKKLNQLLDYSLFRKIYRSSHPIKQQLYGHLPTILKTIQIRRARHAGHCWRSKDEHISDILLWTNSHGGARFGRPYRTYQRQFRTDTGLAWKTCRERWTIETSFETGKSVLAAGHNDDDDESWNQLIINYSIGLGWFLCLMAYQLFLGYLMPKPFS